MRESKGRLREKDAPFQRVPFLDWRHAPLLFQPQIDPACLVTATGNAPQVELSQGCPGQRAVLEEPQLAKEQTDDREHEKEDTEVDEAEKTLPEPECNVSVPEDHHEDRQEEEAGDREEENVQVVDEEEEANRRIDLTEGGEKRFYRKRQRWQSCLYWLGNDLQC